MARVIEAAVSVETIIPRNAGARGQQRDRRHGGDTEAGRRSAPQNAYDKQSRTVALELNLIKPAQLFQHVHDDHGYTGDVEDRHRGERADGSQSPVPLHDTAGQERAASPPASGNLMTSGRKCRSPAPPQNLPPPRPSSTVSRASAVPLAPAAAPTTVSTGSELVRPDGLGQPLAGHAAAACRAPSTMSHLVRHCGNFSRRRPLPAYQARRGAPQHRLRIGNPVHHLAVEHRQAGSGKFVADVPRDDGIAGSLRQHATDQRVPAVGTAWSKY